MADVPSNQSTNVIAGTGMTITFTENEGDYWDITFESTGGSITDHTHESAGAQGGTLDHGLALTGLTDDDHTQYRLESADHTHQSTGLQAGQLDHGLALTGLTDDDHTQYLKESVLSEANATDLTDGGQTALHSHAGSGATIDLQEETVLKVSATAINFDGDDFDVTDSGGGVGLIDVAATHAGSTHSAATDTHIADAADAHDASAISVDSTTLSGTGTDVQASLEEIDNLLDDHSARHENGGADEISLAGLDGTGTALQAHLDDAADAHDASAISILDTAADFTATDVEGALAELQSDNEAHVAAADPHTGYRLESADHTHQSTGAQAGQLDHGLALTGLTDDDHTQYRLESADHTHQSTGAQAGTLDHGLALTGLTDDDHTQYLKESDVDAVEFSIGAFFDGNGSTLATGQRPIWRAPFGATVTAVRAYADTGTTTVVNAGILGTGAFCSANITIDPADAWESGTVNQNTTLTADTSTVYVDIVTAGTATQITFQIEMTRDLSP